MEADYATAFSLETLGAYDTLQRAAHASIDYGENGMPRSLKERVGSA
jgi:hypothetical protein